MSASDLTSEKVSTSSPHPEDSPRRRLRALLERDEIVQVAGIHDAFSARAAEKLGFEAVYLGGGVTVGIGYHAVPDMTMIHQRDIVEAARPITRAIDIPLIVDFDDGGGNPLQVRYAMQLAEAAGIAGVQIEDTDFAYPKHSPPKQLGNIMRFDDNHHLSRDAAVERIRAAVEARRDPDMIIIGRTDGGLISKEESLIRMKMMADAGADVIMPTHFPFEDAREAVEACGRPVMMVPLRVGSSTSEEREQATQGGVKMLLEPTPVSYAIYEAVIKTLRELKETSGVEADHTETMKFVQETIRWPEWGDLAERYRV